MFFTARFPQEGKVKVSANTDLEEEAFSESSGGEKSLPKISRWLGFSTPPFDENAIIIALKSDRTPVLCEVDT